MSSSTRRRGAAIELHNCDFMDMIYRGWKMVDKARRMQSSEPGLVKPKVGGFDVDLSPVLRKRSARQPAAVRVPCLCDDGPVLGDDATL